MTQAKQQDRPIVLALVGMTALLALLYSAYIAIRYSGQHILIRNFTFRETQTALTSYWACRDGFRLDYETPVAGAPWSIPFEFPIYQWIVSLISCPLGINMERVGRLVNYAFVVACMLPATRICWSLFKEHWKLHALAFCAIFFSAPLYIFFGRSFLMEGAALFFSLCYVSYAISLVQGDRAMRTAILAGLYLTLAILQKSTTVLPLVPLGGLCFLTVSFREIWVERFKSRGLWLGVVAFVIPFLIGTVWTKYCDAVKELNDFGTQLTSDSLMDWTLGGDRFDWRLWLWAIWIRNVVTNVGGWVGIGILTVGVLVLDNRHRYAIVAGGLLFLIYFMVFTNLHYIHEYYQMANTVFLIFAVAMALGGAIASSNRLFSVAGLVVTAVLAFQNVQTFRKGQNFQWMHIVYGSDDPVLESTNFIAANTDKAKPIVVYGDDWSSTFPFFSERKAFVVQNGFKDRDDLIAHPAKYLDGQEPSAILACRDERTPELEAKIQEGFPTTTVKHLQLCDIFLRN